MTWQETFKRFSLAEDATPREAVEHFGEDECLSLAEWKNGMAEIISAFEQRGLQAGREEVFAAISPHCDEAYLDYDDSYMCGRACTEQPCVLLKTCPLAAAAPEPEEKP
jgi:hypothetical protein